MEYTIVTHFSATEFDNLCTEKLAEGWQLQSGVSIAYQSSSGPCYAQAFTRQVA